MRAKDEILEIPRSVKATLEGARQEYESVIRRAKWSECLVYFVGDGSAISIARRGALSFETLLEWPAVARSSANFQAYTLPVLRPRSLVILVFPRLDSETTARIASQVHAKGSSLWVLGTEPFGSLTEWVNIAKAKELMQVNEPSVQAEFCGHASATYLALTAARMLKSPQSPALKILEEEFQTLPDHLDRLLTHHREAAKTLAATFGRVDRAWVVGGGFYDPTAQAGAWRLEAATSRDIQGLDVSDLPPSACAGFGHRGAITFLSGSRCRVKSLVHRSARSLRQSGVSFSSVTDGNDRELVARSEIAVILPELSEPVGSLAALALLELTALLAGRATRGHRNDKNPIDPWQGRPRP